MNVCMVAYSIYEFDNRVMRYAETLAARGDHVDVVALRQKDDPPRGSVNGVDLFRIQERPLPERGRCTYIFRVLLFLFRAMVFLTKRQIRNRYDLIHEIGRASCRERVFRSV